MRRSGVRALSPHHMTHRERDTAMRFEQKPALVDDYGTSFFRCFVTGVLVSAVDAVPVGARIPGLKARNFIAPGEVARTAWLSEGRSFHESEANCNTCAHLERVPSRERDGFLLGMCSCGKGRTDLIPYSKPDFRTIKFHPEDPMHMPCYLARSRRST